MVLHLEYLGFCAALGFLLGPFHKYWQYIGWACLTVVWLKVAW